MSLLPYSFTFTDPGAAPNSRVQFEHTVFLQINQVAPGQLEVTLSRSSPEAIERKLEEFVELQREATVTAKRSEVTGSKGSTSTRYYVTFQFADGLRAEYRVGSDQYGLLAEGDEGVLLTKGSRFQEFERHP